MSLTRSLCPGLYYADPVQCHYQPGLLLSRYG
jgi:hypothetical protein